MVSLLKDYAKEINKCSKCGLCQSVCPVYKITGNDCTVSRGKFVMLNGILKGDLKFGKVMNKYLDMCLKCGKCQDFCPSAINVCEIFQTAKYEYSKDKIFHKFIFFLQSKIVFGNLLKMFRHHSGTYSYKTKSFKVTYFKGCVNNFFKNDFYEKIPDVEFVEKDFECCGIPFLSSGNLERYEQVKKRNMELLKDAQYVLTDCASCESMLINYFRQNPPNFINLGELVVRQGMKFAFKKDIKVTFHKPCHLKNDDFLTKLLSNCKNVQYVKMDNYDDCCGFAGAFALDNFKIFSEISKKKAENIFKTGADIVITTCPSCILGLKIALWGKKIKIMSVAEFLNSADVVKD